MRKFNKIFCIGFHKTGTSSLRDAFNILNIRAAHWGAHRRNRLLHSLQEGKHNKELDNFDAFMDVPIPSFYSHFDQTYKNSLFILSVRDVKSWSQSVVKHIGGRMRDAKRLAAEERVQYDHWRGPLDIKKCIKKYNTHVKEVKEYFTGRDDFLIFDVKEGWGSLCNFLDIKVPRKPFPHANKSRK